MNYTAGTLDDLTQAIDAANASSADDTIVLTAPIAAGDVSLTLGRAGSGSLSIDGSGLSGASGSLAADIVTLTAGTVVGGRYGVLGTSAPATISNAGTIASGALSPSGVALGGTAGIALPNGGSVTNQAGGVIEGNVGLQTLAGLTALTNAGAIRGGTSYAVDMTGGTVLNTGRIASTGDTFNAFGTTTLLNAGSIVSTGSSAFRKPGSGALFLTNAAGGVLEGAFQGYGSLQTLGGQSTIGNYGSIGAGLSSDSINAYNSTVDISLYAGSITGKVMANHNVNALSLYTGMGSSNLGLVQDGVVIQNGGTLAAAVVGTIDLGDATDAAGRSASTLYLRGEGDGTGVKGAVGVLNLGTVTHVGAVTKADAGLWRLGGPSASPAAVINAGTGTPAGTLQFDGTTGLTGDIVVDGAIVQQITAQAFGTGTIHMVDPTVRFSATSVDANAISLESFDPLADPATFVVDVGVTETLTGAITTRQAPRDDGTAVSPVQDVAVTGGGTLTLSGRNAWTGLTTISGGSSLSIMAAANVGSGGLVLGDAMSAGTLVTTDVGAIVLGGAVVLGAGGGIIDVAAAAGDATLTGAVSGAALTKTGDGTLTLAGANTATRGQFTGMANVNGGTLAVDGVFGDTADLTAATVNVNDTGTLHGSGRVDAAINVNRGGTISAGTSTGVLTTGSLALQAGATFLEEIGGPPGIGPTVASSDRVVVTGTVNLAGSTLAVSFGDGFTPMAGQTYTIIDNDGADAVQGTFAGLVQGSTFTVNGVALVISYRGGDGNDVTLTDPVPPSAAGDSAFFRPTPGPDNLTGTAGDDTIAGLSGDDTLNGFGGDDLLFGNQGDDLVTAGDGNSTVAGGQGDDRITVGNGANLVYGNEGSDTITAGNGGNTIVGGQDSTDGSDLITSGSGNDVVFGNGGDDTVAAGAGADTVVGGFGRDILLGNQGNDIILGNQGDDTLYGGQGADTLVGGQGNDVLYGNEGDDVLYGNEGLNTFVFAPGDTDFRSGVSTGDIVADFTAGTSRIDFASGPIGTASNFGATSTTAADFASIQAAAQALINGGDAYAFVADGVDGFLFTTGGTRTAITDAVKFAGAGSANAMKFTDIAHGALA